MCWRSWTRLRAGAAFTYGCDAAPRFTVIAYALDGLQADLELAAIVVQGAPRNEPGEETDEPINWRRAY